MPGFQLQDSDIIGLGFGPSISIKKKNKKTTQHVHMCVSMTGESLQNPIQ